MQVWVGKCRREAPGEKHQRSLRDLVFLPFVSFVFAFGQRETFEPVTSPGLRLSAQIHKLQIHATPDAMLCMMKLVPFHVAGSRLS